MTCDYSIIHQTVKDLNIGKVINCILFVVL